MMCFIIFKLIIRMVLCFIFAKCCQSYNWNSIDLHEKHMPFYFNNNPRLSELCRSDSMCPFHKHMNQTACWGYENDCDVLNRYSSPMCNGDHKGWVHSKEEQLKTFYSQADFGYVKEKHEELKVFCHAENQEDSFLECNEHLQFCHGRNIYLDLRDLLQRKDPLRYNMDVLRMGQIGGHCRLDRQLLLENCDQISPLQSWGPELRYFVQKSELIKPGPVCDQWIETPMVIMKIDATVNMYHHFCDFLNLYISQHLNSSDTKFSRNIQILIWESYPYHSNFGSTWTAFSQNPVWTLNDVAGKRICLRNVILPLLPRMIFGLYYNTPIIWGCERSGLFHSFSNHILHRLRIPSRSLRDGTIHVSFLSRQTTHRRIINEAQLLNALEARNDFLVKKVEFSHSMDFRMQLRQDTWTDIFVGIHGAGLTHLIFLPDWAVVFELYNCGDINCYQDLSRLRGIKYITWEDARKVKAEDEGSHPDLGAHEKFTNYQFDVDEFMRLMQQAVSYVKKHHAWNNLPQVKNRNEL